MRQNIDITHEKPIKIEDFLTSSNPSVRRNRKFKESLDVSVDGLSEKIDGKFIIKVCPSVVSVNGGKRSCICVRATCQVQIENVIFGKSIRALLLPDNLVTVRQIIVRYAKSEKDSCYRGDLLEQLPNRCVSRTFRSTAPNVGKDLFTDEKACSHRYISTVGSSDILTEGASFLLMRMFASSKDMKRPLKLRMIDSNLALWDTIFTKIHVKPGRFQIRIDKTYGDEKENVTVDYRSTRWQIENLIRWQMKGTSIEGSDKIRRTIMELQGVERDTERQFEVKQSKSKPVEKEYSSVLSRVSSCKFRVLQSATGERTCFNDQALDNTKSGAKEIECPKILSETEKFDRALTKFEKTFTRNLICNFKFVACDVRSKSPDRQKVSKKGKKRRKSKNINEVVGYMAAFCNSFERTSNQRNVDEDRDEVDSVISNETDFGFDYLLDQSVNMNAISKIMPNDCDSTTDVSFLFEKETKSENTSRCRNASKTDQIFVPLSDENSPQLVVDNKEVLKSYSFEGISWENSASNINSSLKANDHRSDTIFNALTEIFTPIFYLTKNVSAKVIDSVVQSVSKNEILSIVKPETSTPLSFINNLISPLVSLKEGSKIATADYIRRHPELKAQILVYIERVLLEEPADLQLFAAQHFSPNN